MTTGPQQYYPSYPPMGAPPQGQPSTPRRTRLVVAAVVAGLAAVLTVVSMFLDYNSYVATENGQVSFAQHSTPWGASYTLSEGREAPAGTIPLYGIALALLLAALLAGAALAVVASSRAAAPGRLRAARATAILYGAAAVSIELMLALTVLAFISHEQEANPGDSWVYSYNLEPGFWSLLGMAVLAAVAAVLTLLPERDARGGAPFDQRYAPGWQPAPIQAPPQAPIQPQQPYPYYGQQGYGPG